MSKKWYNIDGIIVTSTDQKFKHSQIYIDDNGEKYTREYNFNLKDFILKCVPNQTQPAPKTNRTPGTHNQTTKVVNLSSTKL